MVRMCVLNPSNLKAVPESREFISNVIKKYGVRSIDAINALKKAISLLRRIGAEIDLGILYQFVENSIAKCLDRATMKLDMNCFTSSLERLLRRDEQQKAGDISFEVKAILDDVDRVLQRLVDLSLKLPDSHMIDEVFSVVENKVKEARKEVEAWIRLREISRNIDYGKLIREIRVSR